MILVLIFTDKFSLELEAISFQPAAIFLSIEACAGSVTGEHLSYAPSS
jgi:hypothetical protein